MVKYPLLPLVIILLMYLPACQPNDPATPPQQNSAVERVDRNNAEVRVGPASAETGAASQYVTTPLVPEQVSFAGHTIPLERDDVREALEYELTVNMFRHSRTLTIMKNIERWRPLIEQTLLENGVPTDFIYLAVAESEFDNTAHSYAGAVGMWQFMESTAKDFGLHIDKDADMRRDPKLATEAACRYLNGAYSIFKDWTLVAASYNRGMSGIQNIMKDQQATSFFDMHLNPETERYVYRIIAFKLILENPEAYGYHLAAGDRYKPYAFTTKTVEGGEQINLVEFAKNHNTTYKELRRLNPWFSNTSSYSLTVPKKMAYTIRVPALTAQVSKN
jgi:membrane-bound lytic murein transglycosylase D